MPIYPDLNCIFIHIPKTAGGSIEGLLKAHALPRSENLFRRITSNLPFAEPLDRVCIRGHDSARWIRTKIGADLYARFKSFAVVRDPYDRAISSYEYVRQNTRHHRNARVSGQTFEEFLARDHGPSQADYVTDGQGKLIVDEIARFETLHADLERVFTRLGITERLDTRRSNTSEKRARSDYLTPAAVAAINRAAAPDFDLFGYPKL